LAIAPSLANRVPETAVADAVAAAPEPAPASTPAPAAERNIPGLTPALKRRLRALFALLTAVSPSIAARVALRLFTRPLARPMTPEDAAFLRQARSATLATAAGRLRLYDWTPAPSAPAVLMVHGWRSHAARLRALIEALQARGLRVIAFDAPGHGRSRGRRLDLEIYCEAVSAVVRARGPVAAVVAHSFGALAAASWLADSPDAAALSAAVLIAPPFDAGYLLDGFTGALALEPAVIVRLRGLFRRRYGRDPESYRADELARRIHLPVLLLHGAADELVPPAHSEQVAESFRNARLQILPAMSHGGPLREPAAVSLVADFIGERVLAGRT
jgi:alpha-beta hydrolase superfamily lysophospholipase